MIIKKAGNKTVILKMDLNEFQILKQLIGLGNISIIYDRDLSEKTKKEMGEVASKVESFGE